jgi:outer membrane protein OmpA-like peptidoglycan-associated protein
MLSQFAAITSALVLCVVGGFLVTHSLAPHRMPPQSSKPDKPIGPNQWLQNRNLLFAVGFLAIAGSSALVLLAPNLGPAILVVIPAGVLIGGLAYGSTRLPPGHSSSSEVYRSALRRRALLLCTAIGIAVAAVAALTRDLVSSPAAVNGGAEGARPGATVDPSPAGRSDTLIVSTIEKSLRASVGMDFTPLARAVENLTGGKLPGALDIAGIAADAGRRFASSVADRSGQNFSDLFFDWIKRERSYSPETQRASQQPSDTAASAPALHVVRFDHGRSELPSSGTSLVEDIADIHRSSRAIIFLVGSADRTGGSGRNLRLARERNRRVAELLARHGVPGIRIFSLARPESAGPFLTGDGVLEPENRRVEVWIR